MKLMITRRVLKGATERLRELRVAKRAKSVLLQKAEFRRAFYIFKLYKVAMYKSKQNEVKRHSQMHDGQHIYSRSKLEMHHMNDKI